MPGGIHDRHVLGDLRGNYRQARFRHATNVNLNMHEPGGGELRLDATRRDVEVLEISEQARERAGIICGCDAQPKKREGFGFLDSHLISSSDPVLEVRTQTRPGFPRKPGT
jgi:hypothetical protein